MAKGSIDRIQESVFINRASEVFEKLIPFKVYRVDNFTGTNRHTHDYIQIWYVMSGCCEHHITTGSNYLTKGSLFVLPPFITHEIKPFAGDEAKIIGCEFLSSFINENIPEMGRKDSLFDFAYLEPFIVSNECVRPRLQLRGKTQVKVEELLLEMLDEYEKEEKYYEINIKADLLKLLAIIAREYEYQDVNENTELFDKYRDAVSAALEYIDTNYCRQVYIDEACRIAMMSQSYFSHLFKQLTGKTFVEYVNARRINKAAEMLVKGEVSISEICFAVGFNDTTYFNRVFKRGTGLSPRQYRKLSRTR